MTERGLPIVDGAPACPFVAFADDRDERATSPDHRHRCYAEAEPAPRALAHQEAYCLSSAFPVCPTFQDWARREAARTRPPEARLPGEGDDDEFPPLIPDRPPRRAGQAWSAPPPWLGSQQGQPGHGTPPAGQAIPGQGVPADDQRQGAAAGSGADAAAGGAAPAAGAAGAAAAAGGLAGSFADRLVTNREPPPPGPEPEWEPEDAEDWGDDRADEPPSRPGRSEATSGRPSEPPAGQGPRRREHERSDTARDFDQRERDAWAPAWERPRRLEAYPTIRSRRLSTSVLPSLAIAVIAILLAAAALFFLPSLLGIGSGPAGSSTPGPSATPGPSVSAEPTIAPAETPLLYTVKAGDTMSRIANRFHVPLQTLIDANAATIPNPDNLKIGDVLIIPTATPSELPGASASP